MNKRQPGSLQCKLALPAVLALLLAASLPAQAASSFDLRSKKGDGNSAEYSW